MKVVTYCASGVFPLTKPVPDTCKHTPDTNTLSSHHYAARIFGLAFQHAFSQTPASDFITQCINYSWGKHIPDLWTQAAKDLTHQTVSAHPLNVSIPSVSVSTERQTGQERGGGGREMCACFHSVTSSCLHPHMSRVCLYSLCMRNVSRFV